MIPKIIHYCWFGNKPMPNDQMAYVEGWKKLLPDYEFRLWNESNFDINIVEFTKQVAQMEKWGFIVDYVRAYVVYNYGGIYLDTDVELLKSLDDLLQDNVCFGGFVFVESEKSVIAPGLIFAGEKGCVIGKELMDFYSDYNFIKKDGSLNLTASPKIFTDILAKHGLKRDDSYQKLSVFTAYPSDYFSPMGDAGKITLSKNTYSIHHYAASWYSPWQKIKKGIINICKKIGITRWLYKQYTRIKYGKTE